MKNIPSVQTTAAFSVGSKSDASAGKAPWTISLTVLVSSQFRRAVNSDLGLTWEDNDTVKWQKTTVPRQRDITYRVSVFPAREGSRFKFGLDLGRQWRGKVALEGRRATLGVQPPIAISLARDSSRSPNVHFLNAALSTHDAA